MGDGGKGHRALVIGASAGIGRATALRLGVLGYRLVVVGRRQERLDEVIAEIGAGVALSADLTDSSQCVTVVDEVVSDLGQIDLLVYAAGASRLMRLRDVNESEWSDILRANLIAPAQLLRAALPHLSTGAVVCLLSSESVGQPREGLVPYSVSKAALEELVRGLRVEHPQVRFCCLRVGATDGTEFARDFSGELAIELFPRWIASGLLPAQLMQVQEVGSTIADLLAVAVSAPGVEVQDLTLRGPGGPYVGENGQIMENVDRTFSSSP